jgi:hypothetical protein
MGLVIFDFTQNVHSVHPDVQIMVQHLFLSNRQGQVHSDVFSCVTRSQTQVQRQDERALYDATEEEKEALRPTFTFTVDRVCTYFSFCTNS